MILQEQSYLFNVDPEKGILEFSDEKRVVFGFTPAMVGSYEIKLPIFLADRPAKPYQEIILRGVGADPRILFDRRHIILPVVPLGCLAKT